ncbi:MAG: ABC transporter substrate-binding protein [Clostridiales bacterium]|nr:ABC transporter substrate-binding protein [Clostridiales bacterium]
MRRIKESILLMLVLCMGFGSLSGCSGNVGGAESAGNEAAEAEASKTFIFGDTTFNPENEEPDVNPHRAYSGWACIRYGIGETLFHYSDSMEMEPWLAVGYENPDERTWVITLRDGVTFSSGRKMDGEAVKECLEHLIETHDRARGDLSIESIEADGQVITITTSEPKPAFLNYLSDPYGCIIDMQAGITDDGIVAGTGPYIAISLVSGERLELVKNEDYWDGTPGYDSITVRTISDGDTLTLALQSGEIDGAYGLPYASYAIFQNEDYHISSCATSRAFFLEMNAKSAVIADDAVRQAIAMGIDKDGFVNTLLQGNGYAAVGIYPDSFSFGGDAVKAEKYDPDGAKAILDAAGWLDRDGDGYREKDGTKLSIRWLTYPSRQELPLLAESAQATLKEIGIEVAINSTADHNSLRVDPAAWDVYVSAMVTAPTGDPEYFFTTHCLDSSSANNGSYHSDELESLAAEMAATFDVSQRAELAVQMQQVILDDHAFVFCSHLKMSMVSRASASGLTAHPCDFYEITADLAPVS